jgi:hypothetical protein
LMLSLICLPPLNAAVIQLIIVRNDAFFRILILDV